MVDAPAAGRGERRWRPSRLDGLAAQERAGLAAEQRGQDRTDKTAAALGDIVQAVREKRNRDVPGIVMQARKDGLVLTQKQIQEAVQSAMQTQVQRSVHQAPKVDRPLLYKQGKGVEATLGAP